MSSSPLGTDLDHPFRRFESRSSILLDRNVHFSEPHSPKPHRSDPLNLKISEILGPFVHVSGHLLSELKDSPDNLFGIERNTDISPRNHRRPSSSEQKFKMIGQNSRPVSPPGKKQTPRQPFNPTGQRSNQVTKQQKSQQIPDNKPRPTNQYPVHNSGKHGSRTFVPSPSSNSTTMTHKNSPFSRVNRYDAPVSQQDSCPDSKMKKPMTSSFPFSKRPDKVKKEEHSINSRKILHSDTVNRNRQRNGDDLELLQKVSPKEDIKTVNVLPGRVLKPPPDKSRPPTNRNVEETTPKRNQIPNLDLSLDRSKLHDDSFNDLFDTGMEPLPTPLTEIQTPVGNKKFLAFPSIQSKSGLDVSQSKELAHISTRVVERDNLTNKQAAQSSSESDSSESESEHEAETHNQTEITNKRANFLDLIVSSDSDSMDSSPVQAPSYSNREELFVPSPPKRSRPVSEQPNLHGDRGWNSSPSSDSSNSDSWNRNHTSVAKPEYPHWGSNRSSSPRDLNPPILNHTDSLMHLNNATSRSKMSHDSDSSSPDRKRLKISISLDKIALPDKIKPLIVSFPRVKISLPGDKPPESSKQMARVQPIQRHLPDSVTDLSATINAYNCPPRVAEVQPQQKVSRKDPHNMIGSPDIPWLRETYEPPPPPPAQIITPTQSSSGERWGTSCHTDLSYPSKLTRLSSSHDYLTEAKDLKHQADHFKSSYKKALFYCEAALSFMLYGDQLEITSKNDAISTYSDTFDLLDFVLRPGSSSRGGLGFSKQCPQLIILCLRCQAVILNRIFVIKQESLKTTHRELHEFFSVYKSDTKAKTPLSNKSPFADSSWSPTHFVQVPQKIATMNSDYLQVLEYQFNSMELWSKSLVYEDDTLPFIQKLNSSIGKPIEIYSSIKDTTTWCKLGLHWLRKDHT